MFLPKERGALSAVFFYHKEGKAYMVFRTSDEKAFLAKLAASGIVPCTKEDLGLK